MIIGIDPKVDYAFKHLFEELKMLTKTELERERYEARRKAQLDEQTQLTVARMEGEKIGVIHFCERLLNRSETPTDELARLEFEELTRLADDLQREALNRA